MSLARRYRVLVVAKGFPPEIGGVETYSEQIANGYVSQECEVTVVTRFPIEKIINSAAEVNAFKIINVGTSAFQPLVFIRFLSVLIKLFALGERFDLVHASTWRAFLPILALKTLGIRLGRADAITVHGREILQTKGTLYRIMSFCFRRVDHVICISEFSRKQCEAHCLALSGKAIVAWNGISWPQETPKTDYSIDVRNVKILAVSQLTKRKNVATLINVVRRINTAGKVTVRLKIAGDGNQRASLNEQISNLGLQDEVSLLGMVQREDLPSLYRQADIFVHPHSHSHDKTDVETFCLAVADGMALGVPTISGRDGAPSEYIVSRENGIIVDGANEEELYAAIVELITADAKHREALGQRARSFAMGNFSWSQHVGKVLDALGARR